MDAFDTIRRKFEHTENVPVEIFKFLNKCEHLYSQNGTTGHQ